MKEVDSIMFKSLILAGSLLFNPTFFEYNGDIAEIHEITQIKGNEIYGENISGKGEGIFYYKYQFLKEGVKRVEVGDKVLISWSKKDYFDENWDEFDVKKVD